MDREEHDRLPSPASPGREMAASPSSMRSGPLTPSTTSEHLSPKKAVELEELPLTLARMGVIRAPCDEEEEAEGTVASMHLNLRS